MIAVNFKTYSQGSGEAAVKLAEVCKKISQEYQIRVIAIPQLADLTRCVQTGVECWVQHVDGELPGKNTGRVILEEVVSAGAKGTLLNHSEYRLDKEVIVKTNERIKQLPKAFELCLCAKDAEEAVELSRLAPDFVAYEPPELIGSRDRSVATEKPEVIKQVTDSVTVAVLIGAGVHTAMDVKVGLSLGAAGILLASDIMLANDPEKELRELAEAFGSK